MTVSELARVLGKSRQTVYQKLKKGFTVEDLLLIARELYGDDVRLILDIPRRGRPKKEERRKQDEAASGR